MDSQSKSSRHHLVRETSQTSLWTTSPRRSETMVTETLLERRVRRRWTTALDNHFDVRQGKAEAIQDHVNGEDMMSLSLQNSSKIALDEKIRAKWVPAHQPYQRDRRYPNRPRRKHWSVCCEDGNSTDNLFETERRSSRCPP